MTLAKLKYKVYHFVAIVLLFQKHEAIFNDFACGATPAASDVSVMSGMPDNGS